MKKYDRIFAELIRVQEFEAAVKAVCGEITPDRQKIIDERYMDAKRSVRDALAEIKDPLDKPILQGSRRTFAHSEHQVSFWIEHDCPDESDAEVAEYVREAYCYYSGPGGMYQEADWKRTKYGLLIILTEGMDI